MKFDKFTSLLLVPITSASRAHAESIVSRMSLSATPPECTMKSSRKLVGTSVGAVRGDVLGIGGSRMSLGVAPKYDIRY